MYVKEFLCESLSGVKNLSGVKVPACKDLCAYMMLCEEVSARKKIMQKLLGHSNLGQSFNDHNVFMQRSARKSPKNKECGAKKGTKSSRTQQTKQKTREIGLKKAKWLSRIQILRCCTSYNISNKYTLLGVSSKKSDNPGCP